jgi:regulator of nucleoside diphosphate kinase
MNNDVIMMTEQDLLRIKNILEFQNAEDFERLEFELERAKIISASEVPADLVTMNTRVRYLNVQENKELIVTVVYPSEANSEEGKVSVLTPLGSALIGLRVGQEISWPFPDGKTKTLRILEVLAQSHSRSS